MARSLRRRGGARGQRIAGSVALSQCIIGVHTHDSVRRAVCLRDTAGTPLFSDDTSLDSLRAQSARSRVATAVRDTEHAYCFAGDSYARYGLKTAAVGNGYPRLISDGWKGVHHEPAPDSDSNLGGHLTALFSSHGKVFFFFGNSYVRFELKQNQVDPGYPKCIKRHWRGLWAADIDAILQVASGTAYFIKGTVQDDPPDACDRRRPWM